MVEAQCYYLFSRGFLTVLVFNLTFLREVQIFWGLPILTVKSRALVTLMQWQLHSSSPAD